MDVGGRDGGGLVVSSDVDGDVLREESACATGVEEEKDVRGR